MKETVILLHGIFRGKLDMWPLQKYLELNGYKVLNISYPARRKDLESLAVYLDRKIKKHRNYNPDAKMHFVTHSLGGLLARYYIRDYKPKNLGRVVMLGSPNTGSEWADYMVTSKWLKPAYKLLFGPVGLQLLTTHVHDDDISDYDLGIIAGRKSAVPFAKYVLSGEHDGMVPVARTKLPRMTDFLVMEATHTYMIWNFDIMKQMKGFLREGKFG